MVNEKKEIQGTTETNSAENSSVGNKPESTILIDGANKAAERLETANRQQEALLNRQEELMARQALGGRADAVGENSREVKKDTPKEYAEKLLRGEVDPLGLNGTPKN